MSSGKDASVPVSGLRVGSFRDGDTQVVVLEGELDLATVEEVERELERAACTDARLIVVDLRELEFMACIGLRAIFVAHKREAGRLILVRGPRCVQQVFEISGLIRLLAFVDEPPGCEGANRSSATPRAEVTIASPASDGCRAEGCS
jgi:anti-anti-sigma factor